MPPTLLTDFKTDIATALASRPSNDINLPLLEKAKEVATLAFSQGRDDALNTAHDVLNSLLKSDFQLPSPQSSLGAERSPTLFAVKQILVTNFLAVMDGKLNQAKLFKGGDFKRWWTETIAEHQACPHELFAYLAKEGTAECLKEFIRQDATVHIPFDDCLAMMQVGTRYDIKDEFFENFADEVGHGGDHEDHMDMFDRMLKGIGVNPGTTESVAWQAVACANLLMICSLYRSMFYIGIGYMGCVEALIPGRFSHIVKAGRRLGYDDETLQFYIEHAECDTEHAEGWIDHVILPTIQQHPESARDIAKGLLYRLAISDLFWGHIQRTLLQARSPRAA